MAPTDDVIPIRRPLTPIRDTVLMTNARDQSSVGREIEAEIDSADRIDLVLAFIRWTGIRQLLPHLRRHVEAGKPLRIITTTYTGSTELRALEALTDFGGQVRVESLAQLYHRERQSHRLSLQSLAARVQKSTQGLSPWVDQAVLLPRHR